MIEADRVTVSLGDATVLEDVSLSVDPGEFVGLIGPNGAGKTTLLRTINGAITPDAGTVTLADDRLSDLSARETSRRVATVHQDTSVQFAFDVETVVAMGRTPHRSRFGSDPDGGEIVEAALERTDIDDLRERRISEVSGGERQRVFLARALAQDAPGLLLDEPTANLDVNHAAETLSLVRGLVDDGKAALGAIHDLDAAARYCDRLVLLEGGRVIARGDPESVLTADSIQAAFDAESVVTTNPATGTPAVTALPTPTEGGRRVHVLGGGPSAARVIGDLWAAGHRPSVGPVPTGDAAATVAKSLGIPVRTAPAFAPPPGDALEWARTQTSAAALTVLVDPDLTPGTPLCSTVGPEDAVVLVEERPLSERNHAGADARERYTRLRDRATVVAADEVSRAVAMAAPNPTVSTADD